MFECIVYMYVYDMHAWYLGGHVKAMGPVELESQIVVNHVDAGN